MYYDWKKRLCWSIIIGIILFVILSIMYKFIRCRPDWLSHSLIWSSAWAIGFFIAKTFKVMNISIWKKIIYDVLIIILTLLILLFVLGVLLSVPNYAEYIYFFICSLGMSLIVSNVF